MATSATGTSHADKAIALPDDDAEDGRGLRLVEALSVGSGARPEPAGKVMWAEIICTPAGVAVL